MLMNIANVLAIDPDLIITARVNPTCHPFELKLTIDYTDPTDPKKNSVHILHWFES